MNNLNINLTHDRAYLEMRPKKLYSVFRQKRHNPKVWETITEPNNAILFLEEIKQLKRSTNFKKHNSNM